MGELLHGADDVRNLLDSVARLPQGFGDFLADIRNVGGDGQGCQRCKSLCWRGGFQIVERGQQLVQAGKGIVQKAQIIADILRRGIDLMRDAGGQSADGLQFVRLDEFDLGMFAAGQLRL